MSTLCFQIRRWTIVITYASFDVFVSGVIASSSLHLVEVTCAMHDSIISVCDEV